MKSFVIKFPAKGRTTCTFVRQFYCRLDKRTKTKYLGSFSISANPNDIPSVVKLRPGVELDESEWEEIRSFLIRNSTYGIPTPLTEEQLEMAREQIFHEMQIMTQSALDVLASTINEAASDLSSEVERLRERGWKLSKGMLIYTGTESAGGDNPMDHLKIKVNFIRKAFQEFEASVRDVGLIKTRARKR